MGKNLLLVALVNLSIGVFIGNLVDVRTKAPFFPSAFESFPMSLVLLLTHDGFPGTRGECVV